MAPMLLWFIMAAVSASEASSFEVGRLVSSVLESDLGGGGMCDVVMVRPAMKDVKNVRMEQRLEGNPTIVLRYVKRALN